MTVRFDVKRVSWGTVEIDIGDHETLDIYDEFDLREMALEKLSTFEVLPDTDEIIDIDRDSAVYEEI